MAHRLDVVVVGAGITGLALAERLDSAGMTVQVFEARDRVGGRLLSVPAGDEIADGRVDLGATWFWAHETEVRAQVARFNLRVHEQHIAGDAVYQAGDGVQRLVGNPIDVPALRLSDGMQSLATTLAARLTGRITLDCAVRTIRVESTGESSIVAVDHAAGATHARYVVVALPPALAVARIDFDPALPDEIARLAARTPVWMGAMTKVVAVYDHPFWREQGLAGAAFSHSGPMREVHDMSGPDGQPAALFGFAPSGPTALTRVAIVDQLGALFGDRARDPLALHINDWQSEQWTSPDGASRLTAYDTYGDPRYRRAVHGRIWLASTETAPEHAGHVDGALSAAAMIADSIVAAHRAQDLTEPPASRRNPSR